ncbi:MAG: hypothetical protein ACETWQ_07325 [Phycisphaerae bacterium]
MTNKQDQPLRKRASDALNNIFELAQYILSTTNGISHDIEYDYFDRDSLMNKTGEAYFQIEPTWADGGTIRLYVNSDLTVWRIEFQLLLPDDGWIIIKGKEYNLPDGIYKWFQDSKVVKGTFLDEELTQ